jgi:hypothetical protein
MVIYIMMILVSNMTLVMNIHTGIEISDIIPMSIFIEKEILPV